MNNESKSILKQSSGSLFAAGLAVCLGSGLGILYLECIRLLADSVLTKNSGRIWGIFAVFAASLILSALLLCLQNSKALTIKQRLIESLEQKSMDIWLGSNYKNKENTEKMLPIIRNSMFTIRFPFLFWLTSASLFLQAKKSMAYPKNMPPGSRALSRKKIKILKS